MVSGDAGMPETMRGTPALPEQPALDAGAETIETGKWLYDDYCSGCHGKYAVGRHGGSVPDLRYATAETHAAWAGVVVGGARRLQGMPAFDIGNDDAEAIRAFVLYQSQRLRSRQKRSLSE